MKKSHPAPKVVLVYSLIREKGATVWHRPSPYDNPHCGVLIKCPERMMVEVEHWPPADQELCRRCDDLFEEESRRALSKVFDLLLEVAMRHRAEQKTEGAESC